MRIYRVKEKDNQYYPEWRSFWTFGGWRSFYFTKDSDVDGIVHVRVFDTEDEAWDFIRKKKNEPKFNQYDTIV